MNKYSNLLVDRVYGMEKPELYTFEALEERAKYCLLYKDPEYWNDSSLIIITEEAKRVNPCDGIVCNGYELEHVHEYSQLAFGNVYAGVFINAIISSDKNALEASYPKYKLIEFEDTPFEDAIRQFVPESPAIVPSSEIA